MPPFTHLELNSLNSSQHKESGTKIAGRNAVTLCAQCPFAATTTVFDIQKKTTVRMCHISHTMRRFFFNLFNFPGFAFFWVFLPCYFLPHSSYSFFTRLDWSFSLSYLYVRSARVQREGSPATYVNFYQYVRWHTPENTILLVRDFN